MDLDQIRNKIDQVDDQIFELFQERMELSKEVAEQKKGSGLSLTNHIREREILARLSKKSEELRAYTRMLYSTLFSVSKSYQRKTLFGESAFAKELEHAALNSPRVFPREGTIAIQGIEGSYSQQVADKLFPMGDVMFFKTFDHVFDAVSKGLCDFGILPIENSSNGSVKEVYDLMMKKNFHIVRSYKLYIRHKLLVKPGVSLSEIREVLSHRQALEQCSEFFKENPQITTSYYSNTAMSASTVSQSERRDLAAISSKFCQDLYGLEAIDAEIQNDDNNYTRFICITKDMKIYPGSNKISLMLTAPHEPGGLYHIMARFAALGLNITKLESRPMPGSDFEFMFYFDFEGSVETKDVRDLLDEFYQDTERFAFLGNYQES